MNVDFIFKIAAIGIVVAVVLMMIVTEISNLFDTIKSIFNL